MECSSKLNYTSGKYHIIVIFIILLIKNLVSDNINYNEIDQMNLMKLGGSPYIAVCLRKHTDIFRI